MRRSIAFVGDLHVGSRFAIAPENYTTREGNVLRVNEGQLTLYKYFQDFCEKCDELEVDTIFLMGDLVEGPNPRGFGRNLVMVDLNDQINMAVELLRPLCEGRKVYGVEGSGYHVLPGGVSADQTVVQLLGGEWKGSVSVCQFAPSKLVFLILHGTGGGIVYRATSLDRENLFVNAAIGIGKIPPIHVIVKAHRHFYLYMEQNNQYMLHIPCWCTWVPNKVYLRLYGRMQPDVGGCILQITDDDRIVHHVFLYDPPRIADQKETL